MRQGNRTLMKFMDDLKTVRQKGWSVPADESEAQMRDAVVRRFLKYGHDPELKKTLDVHYTSTNGGFNNLLPEDVLTMAKNLSLSLKREPGVSKQATRAFAQNNVTPSFNRVVCGLCNKPGHNVMQCPNRHNVPNRRILMVENEESSNSDPEITARLQVEQNATVTHDPFVVCEVIALLNQLDTPEVRDNGGMIWCTSCAVTGHDKNNCMNPELKGQDNFVPRRLKNRDLSKEIRSIWEDKELLLELIHEVMDRLPRQINDWYVGPCSYCGVPGHLAGKTCPRVNQEVRKQEAQVVEIKRQAQENYARMAYDKQQRQNQTPPAWNRAPVYGTQQNTAARQNFNNNNNNNNNNIQNPNVQRTNNPVQRAYQQPQGQPTAILRHNQNQNQNINQNQNQAQNQNFNQGRNQQVNMVTEEVVEEELRDEISSAQIEGMMRGNEQENC